MIDPNRLYTAIVQHTNWKVKLKQAVDTGHAWDNYDPSPDHCDFGQWLNANAEQLVLDSHYPAVNELHRQFHRCAEGIVSLAVSGKRAEAEGGLDYGSPFDKCSQDLVKSMLEWHDRLTGK